MLGRPAVFIELRDEPEEFKKLSSWLRDGFCEVFPRLMLLRFAELKLPEPRLIEPELRLIEPELRLIEPELRLIEPELRLIEPELRLIEPELRLIELEFWVTER
ncbi:hypothetical protein OAF56_03185 [Pirellulaceae bacterium]|nr:hypothetical protein [Pirellulaceae bacterium]